MVSTMEKAIDEIENARATLGESSPWSPDTKVSDDFLDPLFNPFSKSWIGESDAKNKLSHPRPICSPRSD